MGAIFDAILGKLRTAVSAPEIGSALAIAAPSELAPIQSLVSGYDQLSKLASMLSSGRAMGVDRYGNSITYAYGCYETLMDASAGRMYYVDNSAVSGNNSTQVLAKIQAEGVAVGASLVPFMEGTNDASQGVSTAIHLSNMRSIGRAIVARGAIPLLVATPPKTGANAPTTSEFALKEAVLAEAMGWRYIDPWRRMVDWSTGGWVAGAADVDGTHPVQAYQIRAGRDFWAQLAAGGRTEFLPRRDAGMGMTYNCLNLTDATSDNMPDGWSPGGLTSAIWVAMTDYPFPRAGRRASFSWSQTAAWTLSKTLSVAPVPGVRYRLTAVLSVGSPVNASVSIRIRCTGSANSDFYAARYVEAATGDEYYSVDFIAPAGTTGATIFIGASPVSAGTHSGSLGFGCIDVINLVADQPT